MSREFHKFVKLISKGCETMGKVDYIQSLCDSRGITFNALEKKLGFSRGSIAKMDTNKPSADKIYALARYFDVPMESFFEDDLSMQYAHIYESLQGHIQSLIEPVYDVACGEGRINGEYATEYMEENEEEDADYTWCEVHGDSMSPVLLDGDMARVELCTQTSPNDLTVIKVDSESVTVKYVEITENGVVLRAENKDVYEDRHFTISEVMTLPVTIIGKVVELKRKF